MTPRLATPVSVRGQHGFALFQQAKGETFRAVVQAVGLKPGD